MILDWIADWWFEIFSVSYLMTKPKLFISTHSLPSSHLSSLCIYFSPPNRGFKFLFFLRLGFLLLSSYSVEYFPTTVEISPYRCCCLWGITRMMFYWKSILPHVHWIYDNWRAHFLISFVNQPLMYKKILSLTQHSIDVCWRNIKLLMMTDGNILLCALLLTIFYKDIIHFKN